MERNVKAKIWERTLDWPYAWSVFEMFFHLSFCAICFSYGTGGLFRGCAKRMSGAAGCFIGSVFYSRYINVNTSSKRTKEILAVYLVTNHFFIASFGLWHWNIKWNFKTSILEKTNQKGK